MTWIDEHVPRLCEKCDKIKPRNKFPISSWKCTECGGDADESKSLKSSRRPRREVPTFEGLTLENFELRIGQRFRMTKDQRKRGLSREEALQEWIQNKVIET